MTEEKTSKTACPNCNTVYRLPNGFIGKLVTCKRCGAKFKAAGGDSRNTYPIIGKLALKYGLITREQLESALVFQSASQDFPAQQTSLDKILFDKGFITEEQMEILNLSQKYWQVSQLSNGFCTIAINKKFITPADADEALKAQSSAFTQYRTIRRASDILIETGKITLEQKEAVLAAQGRLGAGHTGQVKTESEKNTHPIARAEFGLDGEFELIVSEDGLTAMIRPAGGKGIANSVSYVHELLAAEKITQGIVADAKIIAYMETDALEGKPLIVANGTPPKPGTNATIRYYMDSGKKEDKSQVVGIIDYRDRGQLPHVNKGDLLAEKIPATPGEPGVDVYGAKLAPPKSLDQNLRNGAGTVLSADGLKLTAETAGQPKITFGGRLSVLTELKIDGDLDFKTGHVDFDGNIVVSGCVQSGFHVKGHHLTANEIAEANIKVTGDIKVAGGIIGAVINSQGSIQAKYIRDATISAFGDITVIKEIADSTIETSGSCIVSGGKIVDSKISAKQGIHARDIGTELSPPCKLAIGVEAHIEQEIAGIKNAILKREEKRNHLKGKLGMLDVEEQGLHQKITQLAQVQDRSLVEKRSILADLPNLKATGSASAVADAGKRIKELDQKAQSAEAELSILFEMQDRIEKQMQEIELERKHLKDALEELNAGKQSIIEWSKTQKAVAAVTVSGQIHAGTQITGVHTKTHLREMLSHVRIHEVKLTDPDVPDEWEIRLSPIK